MAWLIGIVLAAIFWGLSTLPAVEAANKVQLIQQLGLNLRTTLVTMGSVALMFPLVRMIFLKPLVEAMDTRTRNLENTFQEAESLKQRMTDLKTSYEQKLAESEAEARTKIQAALAEAQGIKEQIIAEAKGQAEEIKARTLEDMRREREQMLVELRAHVVELTLSATEKLINESMDGDRQRKLIESFIEKAEVGS